MEDRLTTNLPAAEQYSALCKELADKSKNALKSLDKDKRYKYMVQVIVGKNEGFGIRMGSR